MGVSDATQLFSFNDDEGMYGKEACMEVLGEVGVHGKK